MLTRSKPAKKTQPARDEARFFAADLDAQPVHVPTSAASLAGFRAWIHSSEFPEHGRISFLRDHLHIELDESSVELPTSALTFKGFQEWALNDNFPKEGQISFLDQEVVLDMSPEELATHNPVKTEVTSVVSFLNKALDKGKLFSDRTLLSNEEAGLLAEPDAVFATWESLESGRVRLQPRRRRPDQFTQLVGSPDWVLEVVSDASVSKDTRKLRLLYHRAGIREYWLIDARGERIVFTVLTWRRTAYVAVAHHDGWVRSKVFGARFRLRRERDRLGLWLYTLDVKRAGPD